MAAAGNECTDFSSSNSQGPRTHPGTVRLDERRKAGWSPRAEPRLALPGQLFPYPLHSLVDSVCSPFSPSLRMRHQSSKEPNFTLTVPGEEDGALQPHSSRHLEPTAAGRGKEESPAPRSLGCSPPCRHLGWHLDFGLLASTGARE